jgi:hypothetical protein
MRNSQRIGLLLVHGVGDQARFEHLHNVSDQVIGTLSAIHGANAVDVIMPGIKGAPLSIMIRDKEGVLDQLDIHEMWWRDLGQRQTLSAILRFWWWASSLAGTRGYFAPPPAGYGNPCSPQAKSGSIDLFDRVKLFLKVTYCFVLLAPINLVISFTHFVPGVKRIQFIHSVFTHLSSVQMYQERVASQRGTLVDFDQTRRVSIQRRLAEILVTMAELDYDRWYIAGHSLGSVIALKGLMYSDRAFAKLINFNRWNHTAFARFRAELDGPCGTLVDEPRAPPWLSPKDTVNTKEIFCKLRGLITYGSPLELFACVWPAIVQVKTRVAIRKDFEWINIYDPVDIVSSSLSSFSFRTNNGETVRPINISVTASKLISSAHVKYWSARHPKREESLLAAVLSWLLSGAEFPKDVTPYKWHASGAAGNRRFAWAVAQWILALFAGCLIWPFAMFGILFAIRFIVPTILNAAFFTLGYFIPLDGIQPGQMFEDGINEILGVLGRLKPEGSLHVDALRVFAVIGISAVFLGILALLRAAIDGMASRRPGIEPSLLSRAVPVDSAVLSGRIPSGTTAASQVDA